MKSLDTKNEKHDFSYGKRLDWNQYYENRFQFIIDSSTPRMFYCVRLPNIMRL